MFYCNKCAEKYNLPITDSKSTGSCQICQEQEVVCNSADVKVPEQPKEKIK